jgi:hypothetical protein
MMRQSFSNCHNLNISLKFTGKIAIPTVGGVQNPSATPTLMQTGPPANAIPSPQQQQQQTQQKVQIVRSSDGKIQVRGLLPGQQLVRKIKIIGSNKNLLKMHQHIFFCERVIFFF